MIIYKIIVLNLGSTSFKFKLFFGEKVLAQGSFENVGGKSSQCRIDSTEWTWKETKQISSHLDAFTCAISVMQDKKQLKNLQELDAVGYKAVFAGENSGVCLVDDALLKKMEVYNRFAPAHNPVYVRLMRQIQDEWPSVKQIACFETAFHSTIPLKRVVYGVPQKWRTDWGIRKYGYHGASHSYIAWEIGQEAPEKKKVISLHLGGSSSVCAIFEGKSIACSMGATPQSGLFHNNRVGDFDVFCLPVLMDHYDCDLNRIMDDLSGESGFLGLSGVSNDLRDVLQAANDGNEQASLAVNAFVDNIVGYVGMFYVYLQGLDELVFTGGIGCGSNKIREDVCKELSFLGIELDENKNNQGEEGIISTSTSKIEVRMIHTNEELMVLRGCISVLDNQNNDTF